MTQPFARRLVDPPVDLRRYEEGHKEGLRAACARDSEIWDIYPVSMTGAHFDHSVEMLSNLPGWTRFIVFEGEHVVGMTNYIQHPDLSGIVEIGGTYIVPELRGCGFNTHMKKLMIHHAFDRGFRLIQFSVDTRNARSLRAVQKLGATHVETRTADFRTWTGFVRDTAVFRLHRGDWEG